MSLRVFFEEERIDRVIGRFHSVAMEILLSPFRAAFGPGKDLSKTIEHATGALIKHDTYAWDFPGTRIILFATNTNDQYDTASLFARSAEPSEKSAE